MKNLDERARAIVDAARYADEPTNHHRKFFDLGQDEHFAFVPVQPREQTIKDADRLGSLGRFVGTCRRRAGQSVHVLR